MPQVSAHATLHHLLSKYQSAYRPAHSTETALLRVQNDILLQLDRSRGVILTLLDLSAAFDTCEHEILLSRLHHKIGLRGSVLRWFKSYLGYISVRSC